VGLVGCQSEPAADERIAISAVRYIGACPVLAAQANGDFARAGITVDLSYAPSG
jgi:ABC-type nitrate/sulfonate/bicarbonate transport system substrate-binding protein